MAASSPGSAAFPVKALDRLLGWKRPDRRHARPASHRLAIDSADRPVLTGYWLSYDPFPCVDSCHSTTKPFIARLQEDGSVDQGFGSSGVFGEAPRQMAYVPLTAGEKVLFVASDPACGPRCGNGEAELGRLSTGGSLDPSFGSGGSSALPFYGAPSVCHGPVRPHRDGWCSAEENAIFLLQRLTSRGAPDDGFGDHGTRWMNLPRGCRRIPQALAVDSHNRPVLASNGRRDGKDYLIVFRRNQKGGRDRTFGDNGQVWTRMPASTSASGS